MNSRKNTNINKGAAILAIFFMLLFFTLIARFGYIETTKTAEGRELTQIAKEKWMNHKKLSAHRGTIFGSNGEALAKDVPAFTVKAILSEDAPEYVKKPEKTAEALAPILDMKKSRLVELLSRDSYLVELGPGGRRISYEKKEKIRKLDLPGIKFIRQSERYYPNQKFASYVLGFTTRDPETDKLQGQMGIEKSMNKKLTGKDGSMKQMTTPDGVQLPGTKEKVQEPQNGDNVYLTINSHIQTFLKQAVTKANKEYDPKRIMAVVMNPKTGEILAMANRPSFNPNTREIEDYQNDIISVSIEPGSVMKVFTLAAAVDAGVYDGDDTYMSGEYPLPGGGAIHDWKNGGWGRITFNQAVQRSSNVGFVILAEKYLGFDSLYDYLMKFDFKKKTGIALPDEVNSNFQYTYFSEKATTAFGQGTAVTIMQMVKAASSIANDGKMMKPYIVDKVVNPNTGKVVLDHKPKVDGTPISAKSAKKVRDLLRTVVTGKHGTGKEFAIEGYKVAGKTGTAQIVGPDGRYLDGKYIHSFIGMAPKDDPQLLVYVAVDRPDVKYSVYGSRPVADIFRSVMKRSLQYLNIDPEKDQKRSADLSMKLGDYKGRSVSDVTKELEGKGMNVVVLGSGNTVTAQMPFAGDTVLSGERIILRTAGKTNMPDLSGWSLADVMKVARLLHLQTEVKGSGYVADQSIKPGQQVKEGETLSVELKVPKPVDPPDQKKAEKGDES
ncbi:MAG TPA: penicillin-binding protein [Bacillales bacterium]